MLADALLSCPTTGRRVERVLQPFIPRYHGSGFYSTDYPKTSGARNTSRGSH
jgi:predicted nucleic acid-binding Zn ribbon protein